MSKGGTKKVIDDKGTLSTSEVARRVGVRLDYLYSLMRGGRIQAFKCDGQWKIPVRSVDLWLERRAVAKRRRNRLLSSQKAAHENQLQVEGT
jgi:excisionase family DNA binding protein